MMVCHSNDNMMHPVISDFLKYKSYRNDCWILAKDDADDLFQETCVILLEMPVEKLDKIYQTNGHRWYIQKLMWHIYCGKRQLFDKKYRDKWLRVDFDTFSLYAKDDDTIPDMLEREEKLNAMESSFDELDLIEQKTLILSNMYSSQREFSRISGIPYVTIRKTLKKIKEKMKYKIENKIKK